MGLLFGFEQSPNLATAHAIEVGGDFDLASHKAKALLCNGGGQIVWNDFDHWPTELSDKEGFAHHSLLNEAREASFGDGNGIGAHGGYILENRHAHLKMAWVGPHSLLRKTPRLL